jgi:oligosaccharide repeat unit polymerase
MNTLRFFKKIFTPDFSNPAIIYSLIWIFTLILYNSEITINIVGLNRSTFFLVSSTILTFIFLYYLYYIYIISKRNYLLFQTNSFEKINNNIEIDKFKNIVNFIYKFWIFGSVIEILLFKGIPLISVVIFRQFDLNYSAFGIPTIHGLLNACYFTLVSSFYLLYRTTKDKHYLKKVLIMLLWPIFLMTRAMILWSMIEVFCIYLIFTKVSLKSIFKVGLVFLFLIVLFGLIGDNRGQVGEVKFTDSFVKDEYKNIVDKIPSGFIWVYLYATTPLNNIVHNIDQIKPSYNFSNTLITLVPSFIRDNITFSPNNDSAFYLYEEAFNVSSYFKGFLNDFGILGTILLTAFIQLISLNFYFSAKRFKIGSIIAYAAIFNALMMSVFYDFFFSLVTVLQIILGVIINRSLYKLKKNV